MSKSIFNSFYQYLIENYRLPEDNQRNDVTWPKALLEHKQKAFEFFKTHGFPSTKQEDWKYTNLAGPLQQVFHIPANDTVADLKTAIANASIKDAHAYHIVLLNGKWQRELSDPLPDGVHFLDGKDALHHYYAEEYFASLADPTGVSLVAMNTAFIPAFNLLHIQKSTDRPLHIMHFYAANEPAFLPERLLLVAEESVQTQWIDTFHQLTSAPVFINYVAEQFLKEHVAMDIFLINQLPSSAVVFHHSETYLHSQSTYHHVNFSFPGAGFIRNNINARMQGSSSEANLWGLYLSGGQQLVDNHTIVDHQVASCNSNEWYKGILQDKSTGVFNGKIFVEKGAQKTNAFQKNNAILLSREATVHAKPQLEIFADDVKCSHGSTVGQMNEDALFYLRTRGLSELTARQLLIEAFAYDILSKVQNDAVAHHVMQLLRQHLHVESALPAGA
ncbi:Fe-S cluster assembly protein SufD [Thermoflavifilum thermophilum]|uniref:Fe-S cluster assembly protein SufD n=1 Tax=Thermoflavifilum thermophilum TaxID=1393122 RepID=A0A1I7N085_9BACT|nr:Fe-S cluster assembly protein SufD [Thermoflavifilum thermophilum]SFV28063.1 Fe-S cluster assembly protein SufD [Thermoflavifilum thermophilum]